MGYGLLTKPTWVKITVIQCFQVYTLFASPDLDTNRLTDAAYARDQHGRKLTVLRHVLMYSLSQVIDHFFIFTILSLLIIT